MTPTPIALTTDRSTTGDLQLLVVVINYRTPQLTVECLRSVADDAEAIPGTRVVVLDNGSNDGSAELLAQAIEDAGWSDWITLETSARNLGFAGGCNRALAVCPTPRYVLLLNSDARVHEGSLRRCLDTMEQNGDIGALSCRVVDAEGSVQNVTRRFPTPARLLVSTLGLASRFPRVFGWADVHDPGWDRRTTSRDVDWIAGAFLLLRGDLLRDIGPLDEDFFFMGEDIELCRRIWQANHRCHYDSTADVTHLGQGSEGPSPAGQRWRRRQLYRARYLYLRKCHGALAAGLVRAADLAAWSLRIPWRRLTHPTGHPSRAEAEEVWQVLKRRL